MIGGLAAFYFVGKGWFEKNFGKYFKQIESLINDLK